MHTALSDLWTRVPTPPPSLAAPRGPSFKARGGGTWRAASARGEAARRLAGRRRSPRTRPPSAQAPLARRRARAQAGRPRPRARKALSDSTLQLWHDLEGTHIAKARSSPEVMARQSYLTTINRKVTMF